jgi:hypothetical protein
VVLDIVGRINGPNESEAGPVAGGSATTWWCWTSVGRINGPNESEAWQLAGVGPREKRK